jgi:two-component system NarL family response regulator
MPMSEATAADEEPIRVVIADDHARFRRGLRLALTGEPHIEVIAEAEDGEQAVALAEELVPDVVLMDIRMPRQNGIDAARQLRASVPSTRIVMLTVSQDDDDLFEAIRAGANGYLLKETPADEVARVIRAVAQGHSLISPTMASKLLREFTALAAQSGEDRGADPKRPARSQGGLDRPPEPALSAREIEVLTLVARGLSNRAIADQLYISENTVKNHVRNILEKLQLHSRIEAVMYAVRQRIVDPHQTAG